MREVFQLVGETAAQSIQSVSAGGDLVPLLTTVDKYGNANYMRLAMDDSADAVRFGKDKLERNDDDKVGAVFVADGFVTIDDGKTDALVVDVRIYTDQVAKCQMVIPYTPAKSAKGFAIHRPQVVSLENIEQTKFQPLLDAFFLGIEEHEEGRKIWHEYYTDQIGSDQESYCGEQFDEQQWRSLLEIPCLTFLAVTGHGAEINSEQFELACEILSSCGRYQSQLLQSLASNAAPQLESLTASIAAEQSDYVESLLAHMELIEHHFSAQEVKGFKIALLALAKDFAHANAEFQGFNGTLNDTAKMALAGLVIALAVKLDA